VNVDVKQQRNVIAAAAATDAFLGETLERID
jgi:hypothetical protein